MQDHTQLVCLDTAAFYLFFSPKDNYKWPPIGSAAELHVSLRYLCGSHMLDIFIFFFPSSAPVDYRNQIIAACVSAREPNIFIDIDNVFLTASVCPSSPHPPFLTCNAVCVCQWDGVPGTLCWCFPPLVFLALKYMLFVWSCDSDWPLQGRKQTNRLLDGWN